MLNKSVCCICIFLIPPKKPKEETENVGRQIIKDNVRLDPLEYPTNENTCSIRKQQKHLPHGYGP